VGGGQVLDMDEIADAGAVGGGVFFAVNFGLLLLAERDL
jgi:hypothetical protein